MSVLRRAWRRLTRWLAHGTDPLYDVVTERAKAEATRKLWAIERRWPDVDRLAREIERALRGI